MKTQICLLLSLFLFINSAIFAEKIIVPITDNGAFTLNTHPSSVYHNGKTFFSWIDSSGSLVISSYDQNTDEVKTAIVASGYSNGDFSSPALLVRASGQILVFASKNGTETNMQCYRSTSTTGDITQGFELSNLTGYGISSTIPFALGDNLVLLWRSKNNLGYTFFAGANTPTATGGLAANGTKRTGFLGDAGFGNNYGQRDEVPVMHASQDTEGNIHIAITQLGTGLRFSNSTIHYVKAVNDNNTGLKFYKASGEDAGPITYVAPPDIVYATSQATDKAFAYDITLIDGKPAILYDAFNGNNVNAETDPGSTSNHTYKIAKWDGTQWVSSIIVEAGEGLPIEQYIAMAIPFRANSYQAGGLCFDVLNPNAVYLSKKDNGGSFELYKYESTDGGATWTETETITSGTPSGTVNIRPIQVFNSPNPHLVDLLWMQGTYTSPREFNTAIVSRGEAQPISSFTFDESIRYLVVNEIIELKVKFSPLFVANREFTLESDNPSVAVITDDGKVQGTGVGKAKITAKAVADNSVTAVCEVVVDQYSVFDIFMERITNEAFTDRISSPAQLEEKVLANLALLQADGSFPDIDYASTDRTDWAPLTHLNRLLEMGLAYTFAESTYFEDAGLKQKMDLMLGYWQTRAPNSSNWYQNQIAEPQRMALYLILIQHLGDEKTPTTLFNNAISRLINKGGNPGDQTGANRVDVALHWIYRACLTADRVLLQTGLDYVFNTISYTTGAEGIQYDNSFTQHGRQMHIGSYGEVFMQGTTRVASYAAGTTFALTDEKRIILSSLVKDSYISVLRGSNIFFNAIGRASTRPNATNKNGGNAIIERMILIDPANAVQYQNALVRLKKEQTPDFEIAPKSNHFFKGDYTVHQRPSYSIDLRMVSTRTARNEYLRDNGEGIRQYFLSDGATGIFLEGDEYLNIFPVWNWAKIPGTTTAELPVIPQANSYILAGNSPVVGGVSDSIHSVSVYQYQDSYTGTNYAGTSATSANKAYFFFDKEVVFLGNGIQSTSEFKVNTTVNQTLLKGDVVVSSNGSETTLATGNYQYSDNLDWALHGNVGYFFPQKGKINLSAQPQSGSWIDINTSYTEQGTVTKDVFSLSFDHGVKPENGDYAYVIVPGLATQADAKAYNVGKIEILVNSDSVQAVYNNESGVLGLVFYRAGSFMGKDVTIVADAACVVMIKDIEKADAVLHIADPQNGNNPIKLGIVTPMVAEARLITYQAESPYQGSSQMFLVNEDLPLYTGRDVLLTRSEWTIVASSEGPVDTAVAPDGDVPAYMIDGDTKSSFLFVKPGRTFGGISVPEGEKPWFMIDLKEVTDMTYLVFRHRDFSNTSSFLRASKGSFYGKNSESEEFKPILENFAIATNATEVRIDFPEKVSYRYVKFVIEEWDAVNGNTIQVSEFYLGNTIPVDNVGTEELNHKHNNLHLNLFPNPVKAGEPFFIRLNDENASALASVYTLTGSKIYETKVIGSVVEMRVNTQGIYVIKIETNNQTALLKAVIR